MASSGLAAISYQRHLSRTSIIRKAEEKRSIMLAKAEGICGNENESIAAGWRHRGAAWRRKPSSRRRKRQSAAGDVIENEKKASAISPGETSGKAAARRNIEGMASAYKRHLASIIMSGGSHQHGSVIDARAWRMARAAAGSISSSKEKPASKPASASLVSSGGENLLSVAA